MTPQAKKDLVRTTLLACLDQKPDVARPHLAENLTWVIPKSMSSILSPASGRDAFLEATRLLGPMFPDGLSVDVRHIHCDGDTVLIEYGCKGTTAGGKLYDNDYCAAFVLGGDRIVSIREYADTRHAAEVLFS